MRSVLDLIQPEMYIDEVDYNAESSFDEYGYLRETELDKFYEEEFLSNPTFRMVAVTKRVLEFGVGIFSTR